MTDKRESWLRSWEAEQMEDPEFREAVERLRPAYEVTRLRLERGLTQQQLAELVGTKQSGIARLESGRTEPSLSFLRRVVKALDARLMIRVVPDEGHDESEGRLVLLAPAGDEIPIHSFPIDRSGLGERDGARASSDGKSVSRPGRHELRVELRSEGEAAWKPVAVVPLEVILALCEGEQQAVSLCRPDRL